MNVRCPYCQHANNLPRPYMEQALVEAAEKKQKTHNVECINCRKTIKVPIKQIRRFVPKTPPAESAAE